jgi:putative flippase GtrA
LRGDTVRKLARFGAIGVASTLAYVLLYAWLREAMTAGWANASALVITAVVNTAANRRLTFEVRGRDGLARDHAVGLLALMAALAITSASLAALDALSPGHGRSTEIVVLVAANVAATLVRFLLLRRALSHRSSHASRSVSRRTPVLASARLAHAPSGALGAVLVAACRGRRSGDLRRLTGGPGLPIDRPPATRSAAPNVPTDRARDAQQSAARALARLTQSERIRG